LKPGISIRVQHLEEAVQIVRRGSVHALRPPLLFKSSLFAALFMNFFLDFEEETTKREPLNLQGSSRIPLDPLRLHLQCQNMASCEGNDGVQNQDIGRGYRHKSL